MRERSVVDKVKRYLNSINAWHVVTTGVALNGCPDILACHNGRFIALEIKQPGGRVSKLQRHHVKEINDKGGVAGIVYSVEDVKKLINL